MASPQNPLALITGVSNGIGANLAASFAKRGYNLILVARSRDRLEVVASAACQQGVAVQVEIEDLSIPGAARRLADRVQRCNRQVDALVNNAGFGLTGPFEKSQPRDLSEMITLNVAAPTELARIFLPAMVCRRQGGVLNVASVAGFSPGPNMAAYFATKAYMLSMSEALWTEFHAAGVTVTALCPGPVETGFADRAAMASTRLFSMRLMPKLTASQVADQGVEGFLRGKRIVVPGFASKLMAIGPKLVPRRLSLEVTKYPISSN